MALTKAIVTGALVLGLAACGGGDDDPAAAATETPTAATPSAAATTTAPSAAAAPTAPAKPAPAPGSLAAYALAADRVCNAAFAASKPVDLDRQGLAQLLADRAQSSALEVSTAQSLLALPRPADPRAAKVPAVLTAHRNAHAAVARAVRADGRALQVRANALVAAEPATKPTSASSGATFLALGSRRCAAWLNPALLQDTEAR